MFTGDDKEIGHFAGHLEWWIGDMKIQRSLCKLYEISITVGGDNR
jgi:hypothetical protein